MKDQEKLTNYETFKHIRRVQEILTVVQAKIALRALEHDLSKTKAPELQVFTEFTPKLKNSTYGSDEYKGFLKEMKVALDHHYANNRHHPEHYEKGIEEMSLIDLIEMLCDWKAATERHADGDIQKSIIINQERFNYPPILSQIFRNTIKEL